MGSRTAANSTAAEETDFSSSSSSTCNIWLQVSLGKPRRTRNTKQWRSFNERFKTFCSSAGKVTEILPFFRIDRFEELRLLWIDRVKTQIKKASVSKSSVSSESIASATASSACVRSPESRTAAVNTLPIASGGCVSVDIDGTGNVQCKENAKVVGVDWASAALRYTKPHWRFLRRTPRFRQVSTGRQTFGTTTVTEEAPIRKREGAGYSTRTRTGKCAERYTQLSVFSISGRPADTFPSSSGKTAYGRMART
jgi:hypothetical protein